MLRIVGVMRMEFSMKIYRDNVYLFDAQNRWGYELRKQDEWVQLACIYSMLRIVGVMSHKLLYGREEGWCIYSMLRIVGVMSFSFRKGNTL